jgi:ATP-dependent Lhr-like helicase
MLAQGFLHAEQGLFSIGPKAEKIFGKRNYMELLSVFETQAEYQVMWGRQVLGVIQPRVLHTDAKQPLIITLAGRNWQMLYRDEKQRRVQVEPTEIKGRSRWFGHGQAAGFALCQALRDFILQQQPADFLSNRGIEHLQELQEDFDWLSADASVLMELDNNVWQWWTFAGMKANAELALNMGTSDNRATANPCWVRFRFSGSYPALVKSLQALLDRLLAGRHQLPPDENEGKFSACIPELLNHLQARHREVDEDALRALRSLAIVRAKVNLP